MHDMRMTHAEPADLNLLPLLSVLLEERHVSRAAARVHLSQSAMSRTLQRLRSTLHDDLLVRAGNDYELTPRARAIHSELEAILPRLRALIHEYEFHPATTAATVRMHCTDYAITILGDQGLFHQIFHTAPHLSMTIGPLGPTTYDDVEHGRVELALSPVKPPRPLRWQTIFEEDFACLVSSDHPVTDSRLTLEHLARFPHVSVIVLPAEDMILERRLRELDIRPPSGLRVPYFGAAVTALPGTTLIATIPRRLAEAHRSDPALRLAEAPAEFTRFDYGMIWHPRLDNDPVNAWIRARIQAAAATATLGPAPE